MISQLRRRALLGTVLLFVISTVASYTPVSAVYDANGEQLQAGRSAKDEYYYYDKDTIVADGGIYREKVVFKKLDLQKYAPDGEGISSIYTPEGDTFPIVDIEGDLSDCTTVPTKGWDKDPEKSNKEPVFFLKVRDQGVVELDWVDGKSEQAFIQWKERRDNKVERNANEPNKGAFSGAYLPDSEPSGSGNDDPNKKYLLQDPVCQYDFYSFFNRLIGKYNDDTLSPGPIRAKIMGRDGMTYADYVKKSDNRLRYLAYRNSAIDAITTECSDKENPFVCTNEIFTEFRTCYGQSVKSSVFVSKTDGVGYSPPSESGVTPKIPGTKVPTIEDTSDIWDNEFDPAKFVECMEKSTKLVPTYFAKKEEAKEFAQSIVDTAILPASLQPRDPEKVEDKEKADDNTRCSLGMMGWILCPVFSFMSQITDKVFELLKNWLTLAPFQPNSSSSGSMAYDVWSKLRNLANVLFIVFFMVIIYSQITGKGLQTYGFRALLPRIIVGTLLVNLSYIICGIAIDLSNIAGDSLFRILTGVNIAAAETQFGTWEEVTATVVLGGGAAAGAVAALANLAAFVPILIMSFIALVTTFLVLLFRQALVIIFVMMAPIAFALYVLPNTSTWFTKWRKTFITLLMLYPVFSLVFGASQMAAEVVRASAAENGETILAIFSLGIQVIPLFLIPIIMKFGGGAIGQLAQMIHKNTPSGLRKGAEEFRDNSKLRQQTRALNGRGIPGLSTLALHGQRRKVKHMYHKSNAHRAAHHLAAHDQAAVVRGLRGLFGSALDKQILDYLGSESSKQKLEEFEASVALIDHADEPISGDELRDMAFKRGNHSNIDESTQAAAMRKLVNNGEIADINSLLAMANKESGQMTDFQREMLVQSIKSSGIAGQAAHLNNANLEAVRNGSIAAGTAGVDSLYASAYEHGYYSADGISNQAAGSIGRRQAGEETSGLLGAMERGAINQDGVAAIRANFQTAANTPKLRDRMSEGSYQAGRRL